MALRRWSFRATPVCADNVGVGVEQRIMDQGRDGTLVPGDLGHTNSLRRLTCDADTDAVPTSTDPMAIVAIQRDGVRAPR